MIAELDPGACRHLAVMCRVAAHNLRVGGYDLEATAYDGSALGFTFRASELEYDARGGMTMRQALAHSVATWGDRH